jgi:O-antigen/teichoic acid export membrane protein
MLLRTLARDSAIYGGADFFSKALAFLTFPIIAAALSPATFGALELVMTATLLLGTLANCGLNNAVQRFYWDPKTAIGERPILVTSGLAVLALLLALALALGAVVTGLIAPRLSAWDMPMTWIALIAALLLMASSQVNQYLLDVIRLHMKPWRFFGVTLLTRVLTAAAGVVAVVVLGWSLDGLLALQALVALAVLPIAAAAVRRDLTPVVDRRVARMLLGFGHPFIYAGLAFWLFGAMDRWMLAAFSSVEEVGVYSVAYRFASVVLFVPLAFGQAWSPISMKLRTDHPARYRSLYADVLLALACGMLLLGGSVALFSNDLIRLAMPAGYAAAAAPLAVLCFGVVIQSTIQVTAIGISIEKATFLFARLSWLAAGLNFLLNLAFIPRFGALGAAWATTLSYLALTASYLYYTQVLHPLPLAWRRLAVWLTLFAMLATASSGLPESYGATLTVGARLALLAGVVAICGWLAPWRTTAHAS